MSAASELLREKWRQSDIDFALEWLLLFQAGESKPLPNEEWIPVALDALRICGAERLDWSGDEEEAAS